MAGAIELHLLWPTDAEPTQELKESFLVRFAEMALGCLAAADESDVKAFPRVTERTLRRASSLATVKIH